ncbi:hypothetical protein NN3_53460 [Nocardia neocaledoniensis NBRC 108232]|uniref:Uncharacterized protein n=1 Tax=Nocardia neocaledoniensis TaxID=236511 RepID=A0A317NAG1_9NOCA|nr:MULTISPECIES: hypothetical protein [Nocardia]PWV72180.1 hypothetical protein DFR69_10995 [Nocardia neocaledoniensis]UGT57821.1 hypothetical protein LTT85_13705 [Nocardia asteroides]GEM34339.1 hypothetical protein NN3_53460 [Nocardia neocaledoniensis NBRC 108232]
MAVNVVLDKVLDKEFENKTLKEILAAPPSALAGLTEAHDKQLLDALKIKTIADLGSNKFFQLAAALVELAEREG